LEDPNALKKANKEAAKKKKRKRGERKKGGKPQHVGGNKGKRLQHCHAYRAGGVHRSGPRRDSILSKMGN